MNRAQAVAALTPGFDPYIGHADTGSIFSSIGHAVSKAARGIGSGVSRVAHDATHPKDLARDSFSVAKYGFNNVVKPAVQKGLPIVQTILKDAGPIGMVASGAIGAMKAGLSGKNLESIAWAAAEGAAPTGIDKAIGAAEAIRHGSNVLKTAINAGVTHFVPGSPEHLGYEAAIGTLKTAANKAALGVARRALPTEGARRAFDAGIGTVAQVVNANPAALMKRANSIPSFSVSKPKGKISPYQPNLKNAIDTLKRNPALASQHPMVLAQQFGTTTQTVLDALRRVSTLRLLPWRSLTPGAARFVRKYHPNAPMAALTHGTADTAGLDQLGTHYIVAKGESPWGIAQKLSGNGNNWTQLKALNTDKKPTVDKSIWTGEVLNIPASWQKPVAAAAPSPGPSLPSQPAPTAPTAAAPAPVIDVSPSILQAKAILVAWSKTDGVNQAGLPDYGQNVADLSTAMGPRDTLELQAFQNWDNKSASAGLPVSGQLDAATLTALQSWAEARAESAVPGVASSAGQSITLPTMVVTAPGEVPGIAIPPVPAGIPALPSGASPLPAVAAKDSPAVSAPSAKKSPLMAGLAGAAIGGVTFGLPGAIIGGVAGAAIG